MNTKLSKHKLAAAGVLAVVLVGGGASIAAASSSDSTTADQEQTDGETADGPDGGPGSDQEGEDASFTGSVAAPAETEQPDGQEASGNEDQESAALQALATVTPQQAEQAAVAAVPGTVGGSELGNENGFVVYSVEIKGTDGNVTEVKIDAGNGAVLAQEAEDGQEAADSADQPEGPNDAQD
ncbi:PepSY domain-containing protein [Blastococcus sp. CT_GayMR16]|uniref:PepSY domain-containing protein n=1 Tax=Blastococcus sp. CT_GayMR16 TaxID=2559607 RepID=UPI001ADDE5C7|nr:PepSY domain-containing protein [Blastococcus sp. CT_GayMR16]